MGEYGVFCRCADVVVYLYDKLDDIPRMDPM